MTARRAAAMAAGALLPPRDERFNLKIDRRPMAAKDGPNSRKHWRFKSERAKGWRDQVASHAFFANWPVLLADNGKGWQVTIRMVAQRGVEMDRDNLQGCCKAIRDGVARFLHVSDAPGGIEWCYEWARGKADATVITLEKIG